MASSIPRSGVCCQSLAAGPPSNRLPRARFFFSLRLSLLHNPNRLLGTSFASPVAPERRRSGLTDAETRGAQWECRIPEHSVLCRSPASAQKHHCQAQSVVKRLIERSGSRRGKLHRGSAEAGESAGIGIEPASPVLEKRAGYNSRRTREADVKPSGRGPTFPEDAGGVGREAPRSKIWLPTKSGDDKEGS